MHSDVTIAGFRFHLGKLSILIASANAISQHPIPTDSKQLKTFTGHAGYYSLLIPLFAEISLPLHKLEQEYKSKRYIKWYTQCIEAFDKLKDSIANSIALSPLHGFGCKCQCNCRPNLTKRSRNRSSGESVKKTAKNRESVSKNNRSPIQ